MSGIIGDLDELLAAIEHEGRAEVEEIQRRATEEVEEIERETEARLEDQAREIRASADAEIARIEGRQTRRTRRQARRGLLEAREEIFDRVWHRAAEQLDGLADDPERYTGALEDLAVLGARILGPGSYELASDERGQPLITSERCARWSRRAADETGAEVTFEPASEPAEIGGGLLVQDGWRRRADLSFATRLDDAREVLRGRVLEVVTGS